MTDLEKVTDGLRACISIGENGVTHGDCRICPYVKSNECRLELERDALKLLKEQDSVDAILVEMLLPNDGSLFLNREYITGYGYSKEQDKTVVSVLSERAPVFFPGDQTAKIRNAFNHISKEVKQK